MKRLCAIAALLFLHPVMGQSTLKVDVQVVSITAVVRDKHDSFLTGLTKDDFVLKEDGKQQNIHYFSEDDDLPLQLGLLIDTSGSEWPYLQQEQDASEKFLSSMLGRKEDQAFLVQFDTNVLLQQSMTPDIAKLMFGISRLRQYHSPRPGGGGTLLFDAIVGTMQNITKNISGRRAVVVLSDGMDEGSKAKLEDAVGWAQMADTTIYTVLYGQGTNSIHLLSEDPHNSGYGVMRFLATSTGGHFFVAGKKQPIEAIYSQIQNELRSYYRLGYVPPSSQPLQYHHIDLQLKIRSSTVQARSGYMIPKP